MVCVLLEDQSYGPILYGSCTESLCIAVRILSTSIPFYNCSLWTLSSHITGPSYLI